MRKLSLLTLLVAFGALQANAQFGKIKINAKHVQAAADVATALTITDAEIAQYSQEYIDWCDKHNPVCDASDPGKKVYADRLAKLVKGHEEENGIKLDIKAYYVVDQNAFACANGSIRVFAGLMDMMTDEELLGIIGHEMGHIVNKDSKDAFRTAYLSSAAKNAVASTGATATALTDSQLGSLGDALANAQFSQKQEYAADDYGYNFLKKNGYDVKGMAAALRKIEKMQNDANVDKAKTKQLFSSHPDSGKRAKRLEDRK